LESNGGTGSFFDYPPRLSSAAGENSVRQRFPFGWGLFFGTPTDMGSPGIWSAARTIPS